MRSTTRDTLDAQVSRFNELLAAGEILLTPEFLDRLKVTRQALSKAVLDNRIFFLEVDGVKGCPAFYADGRYNRGQLEDITRLLGDLSGGSKWVFFTTPKGSLARAGRVARDGQEEGKPRTPLQALADGDIDRVKATATAYAER